MFLLNFFFVFPVFFLVFFSGFFIVFSGSFYIINPNFSKMEATNDTNATKKRKVDFESSLPYVINPNQEDDNQYTSAEDSSDTVECEQEEREQEEREQEVTKQEVTKQVVTDEKYWLFRVHTEVRTLYKTLCTAEVLFMPMYRLDGVEERFLHTEADQATFDVELDEHGKSVDPEHDLLVYVLSLKYDRRPVIPCSLIGTTTVNFSKSLFGL